MSGGEDQLVMVPPTSTGSVVPTWRYANREGRWATKMQASDGEPDWFD